MEIIKNIGMTISFIGIIYDSYQLVHTDDPFERIDLALEKIFLAIFMVGFVLR